MRVKNIFIILFTIGFAGVKLVDAKEQMKWNEQRSQHFLIYYKNAPEDFIISIEEAAEQYYTEITQNLGFTRYNNWTFDKRAKIYIYDDQDDYIHSAKQAGWSHGAVSAQKREIWTFPAAHGFFDSTLPHELGHIVFREFVGFRARIPLWLDEGVAMYQEKAKRWGAHALVKQAMAQNQFIPLDQLMWMYLTNQTPREVVELFYAESASIVYFLITELGEYRFVRFCQKLANGSTFENALHLAYPHYKTIKDLNKAWVKYLEQ